MYTYNIAASKLLLKLVPAVGVGPDSHLIVEHFVLESRKSPQRCGLYVTYKVI